MMPEADGMEQDEHYMFLTGRTSFRHQRLNHFGSTRQFPALRNPRILPSFKRVTDDLARRREEEEELGGFTGALPSAKPERRTKAFIKTTVSAVRQRRMTRRVAKAPVYRNLPFIPAGNGKAMSLTHRTPGMVQGQYESEKQKHREDCRVSREKRLGGAFLPSCAKPPRRTIGHLSMCRPPASVYLPAISRPRGGAAQPPVVQVHDQDQAGPEMMPISEGESSFYVSETSQQKESKGNRLSIVGAGHGSPRSVKAENMSIPIFTNAVTDDSLMSHSMKREQSKVEKQEVEKASTTTFKKFSDEGKIHQGDMVLALEHLGFVIPKQEWIDEGFAKVSKYVSIGLEDFRQFLKEYEALQLAYHKAEFDAADKDGSGSLDYFEVHSLMVRLGLEPMKHVLDKVIEEVDSNQNGTLDFDEFEVIMNIFRKRMGFSKEEYDEISSLFQRFDRDKNGNMDTKEVHVALRWLGFSMTTEAADALIAEVDEDQSGQIDLKEWFICMRKVREMKIQRLREVMVEHDENHDGSIAGSELLGMLRSMGYVPDFDAVHESMARAGIAHDDDDLDLGELWRLLAFYRECEGLSNEDLESVELSFKRYAKGEGEDVEVDVVEIGKMVRSIGYVIDFEMQQNLTCKVDIDGSGRHRA
jgi:calmodulin